MKFEWDFNELVQFSNRIQDGYEFDTAMMTATQNIARVLHKYLLVQTPIDTGNLRKMWSAGDNLMFNVEQVNGGYEVTLINLAQNDKGFRYGLAVNDGHKSQYGGGWVMGRFFVETSILQSTQQVEQIIMKELQKWWDSI